ncbi:MAG: nucleotidyltransferase family protein [Alphaproteobacteria bacterium]|nr:nucleotidyltransferase family protein [Alphaproteobacteria bacterium]MDP6515079.1 nucleotidyltransferase family protein [Alphaproteobacteria bacterium]
MIETVSRRREQELLLLSAQAPFDDAKLARFNDLLDGPIDWTDLVESAYRHALTPLLCRAIELVPASNIPADVRAAAQTHAKDHSVRNLQLSEELRRILDGLEEANIAAIPFKGPVLAEHYYGDVSLRSFHDLDFLIAKDAAAKSVSVLRSLGYTGTGQISSQSRDFVLSPRQDAALWHYAGEYIFFHDDRKIAVEPHWAFAPPTLGLDLDYAAFWNRTRQRALAGRPVRVLDPENTLLSLAVHGGKDAWSRLQSVADLDRVIRCESDIDWDLLLDHARRSGASRILMVALQLARTLFGTDLDPRAGDAIAGDKTVIALAEQRGTALSARQATHSSIREISAYWLRMLERPRDRFRYVFRTAFTPRVQHFEMLPLPDRLFFVYYAIKPAHDYIALPLWIAAKRLQVAGRPP